MINYKVEPLFSKVFFSSILDLDDKQMNMIKNAISIDYESVNNGINNTTKITKTKQLFNEEKLSFLKNEILKHFNYFNDNYLKVVNDFKITTSWATSSLVNQKSHFHNHTNCWYSGIFYVDVDENTGDISFDTLQDQRFNLEKSSYNIYNSKEFTYNPVVKQLILFPSEVYHCINENKTEKNRQSIAFNIMPVGKIGNKNSDSYLEIKC